MRNGVASHRTEALERSIGRSRVARRFPARDGGDLARIWRRREAKTGSPRVFAAHRANAGSFLGERIPLVAVSQAPDFACCRVVAQEELPVVHHSPAETGPQREGDQVPEAPSLSRLGEPLVHPGQESPQRLAVGEQVAVVVDEDGNAVPVLEHRSQRDAAAEGGEVAEVADDPRAIVCRSGKGEGDRRRFPSRGREDLVEAFAKLVEARFQLVGARRKRKGLEQELPAANRVEDQLGPARVERQDQAAIVEEAHHAAPRPRMESASR